MTPPRGRRKGRRWISEIPAVRCFLPDGSPRTEAASLNLEELEAVRLVDLLELEQEEAAFYMGISRRAFWNDLTSARNKIATALVYGMGIRIEGGSYVLRDQKSGDGMGDAAVTSKDAEISLLERELELLSARLELLNARIKSLKGGDEEVGEEGPL
ncbi:DUF134 domain-containing protein [Methanotrichaceae archaeon M04Ac]|uniref:UPF0251 protein P0O24_01520 n=1 Tax=Candidatus Methanocrinis alkalitolerans TaxID=3033395 RepID=A0ABT5XC75_9EURY|nr:DUF134 domain-containing protein [Candidatus Methanocrinis alkalitolerans]MDF0592262.1 DUF134 domain-containing protein [Candidatus Methanocrinis alkalitolerans]